MVTHLHVPWPALQIDTADELLTTELMFDGTFNSLDKHQLVALVSCLIPAEKSTEEIRMTRELAGPLQQLQVGVPLPAVCLAR